MTILAEEKMKEDKAILKKVVKELKEVPQGVLNVRREVLKGN